MGEAGAGHVTYDEMSRLIMASYVVEDKKLVVARRAVCFRRLSSVSSYGPIDCIEIALICKVRCTNQRSD